MLLIGIAGGSGSGKSSVAKKLCDIFKDKAVVICHDSYYKSTTGLSEKEKASLNYDHPDAFDTELMFEHLALLKSGNTAYIPVYDYEKHDRTDATQHVRPTDVVIAEGILLFENEALRSLFDIKVFVDTDSDIRLIRRIKRDVSERGRSLSSVLSQYEKTVKPMHEAFVEPSAEYADIVIKEGAHNEKAIKELSDMIALALCGGKK